MMTIVNGGTSLVLRGMIHGPLETYRDTRLLKESLGGKFLAVPGQPFLLFRVRSLRNTAAEMVTLRSMIMARTGQTMDYCITQLGKHSAAIYKIHYRFQGIIATGPEVEQISEGRADNYTVELEIASTVATGITLYTSLTDAEKVSYSAGRLGDIDLEYYYGDFT